MFQIILSHWATYLFLIWVLAIVVANLWPRKKAENPTQVAQFSPARAERIGSGAVQE